MPTTTTHTDPASIAFLAERNRLARLALERKAQAGGATGRIPLGYFADANEHGISRVIVDEKRAPLIVHAFHLAAEPKASLSQVLTEMHTLGLTAHNGKPLAMSSLHRILTNPFYAGITRYRGVCYQGQHTPLISKTLFRNVKRRLKLRRR